MFIMSCARAYMLRHAERLLADLARLDSMPPPPFKTEFYRLDIDFKDIMPCHQISAHPPDVHQFAELCCLVTATVCQMRDREDFKYGIDRRERVMDRGDSMAPSSRVLELDTSNCRLERHPA